MLQNSGHIILYLPLMYAWDFLLIVKWGILLIDQVADSECAATAITGMAPSVVCLCQKQWTQRVWFSHWHCASDGGLGRYKTSCCIWRFSSEQANWTYSYVSEMDWILVKISTGHRGKQSWYCLSIFLCEAGPESLAGGLFCKWEAGSQHCFDNFWATTTSLRVHDWFRFRNNDAAQNFPTCDLSTSSHRFRVGAEEVFFAWYFECVHLGKRIWMNQNDDGCEKLSSFRPWSFGSDVPLSVADD
jgi:hypothetical protein